MYSHQETTVAASNGGGITSGTINAHLQYSADPSASLAELFPVLGSLGRDEALIKAKPARGLLVFGRLHLTTSAIPAIDVLIAAGIVPSNVILIAKDYPYVHGDHVRTRLQERGVQNVPDGQMDATFLDELARRVKCDGFRVLTIEDGAEIAARIRNNHDLLARWIGGAEQTTRGVWRLERLDVQQPVVALPTSNIKADFEGPHIAASGLHAVKNLFPGVCVADWRVAILGLGTIGRHFLISAEEIGCDVSAFDPDPVQRLRCHHLRAKAVKTTAIDAVRGADLIVGTSGRLTIDAEILAASKGHIRVASLSSERVEVDVAYLNRTSISHERLLRYPAGFPENRVIGTRYFLPNRRSVDLLFDGMPMNFSDLGVLCEKHADLIVAWLILCGLEVARGTFAGRKGILTDAADFVFRQHDLARQFERFWA